MQQVVIFLVIALLVVGLIFGIGVFHEKRREFLRSKRRENNFKDPSSKILHFFQYKLASWHEAAAMLIFGFGQWILYLESPHLNHFDLMVTGVLYGSIPLAGLFYGVCWYYLSFKADHPASRFAFVTAVMVVIVTTTSVAGICNVNFGKQPVIKTVHTRPVDKWGFSFHSGTYGTREKNIQSYLTVPIGDEQYDIFVSRELMNQVRVGKTPIRITIRNGYLGVPWVSKVQTENS